MMAQTAAAARPPQGRRDGAKPKEVHSLTEQLAASNTLCDQLNSDKVKLGNECKESKKAISDLQKVITKATKEADGSQRQIKSLESRVEKAEGKLATANTAKPKEVQSLKEQLEASNVLCDQLNSDKVKLGNECKESKKAISDLQKVITKATKEADGSQRQIKSLESRVEKAEGKLATTLQNEVTALQLKLQSTHPLSATPAAGNAEGLLLQAKEDFECLTNKHSATQRLLEIADAAKVQLEKEKERLLVLVSKTEKKEKKTAEKNTELQSQWERLTRKSTKNRKKCLEHLSELDKKQKENTDLEAASVKNSDRYTELHTKYKKENKRLKSDLRDKQLLEQGLQEKIKNSELQVKKAKDSASKHKTRATELNERLENAECFLQQDQGRGYSHFASPPNRAGQGQGFRLQEPVRGYSKLVTPSPNLGGQGRGSRFSPVPMSPLTPNDDTRTPFDMKKVLKQWSHTNAQTNDTSVAPYMQAENKEVADFFTKNNMSTTRSRSAPTN